ncbi:MAG: putative zinc-binding metallopeptidase [Prevotellaceae bacterium]|nr:putative zinc-binding metallopeptidase [Prevotellaceae bacterium]
MKVRNYIYLLLSMLAITTLPACTDDDALDTSNPIYGLGGEDYVETALDKWIYENFTKPYNISVEYRWNPTEELTATLVPPQEDKVQPVMELIRDVWIKPYETTKGLDFLQANAPKTYMLIGSPKYNTNGTITLGEAEGGNKVTLYRINWFDPSNPDTFQDLVRRILKTTHHEFTHTLNQITRFPDSFLYITASESAWTNIKEGEQARNLGYITPYASDSPTEDFAEMVSMILVYGRDWFNNYVDQADDTVKLLGKDITARQALKQKESIMVEYMKSAWGITFYGTKEEPGLHEMVQTALKAYLLKY